MIPVKSSADEIFAFVRQKGQYKVYAVFNLSGKKVRTELDSRLIAGEYTDLISDKKMQIKSKEWLEFQPWNYRILVATPDE